MKPKYRIVPEVAYSKVDPMPFKVMYKIEVRHFGIWHDFAPANDIVLFRKEMLPELIELLKELEKEPIFAK